MLFEKIQNRIKTFLIKLILYVCDDNNCNTGLINFEKLISLGGYNQLFKGYQITKNVFLTEIFFSLGVRLQKGWESLFYTALYCMPGFSWAEHPVFSNYRTEKIRTFLGF